MSNLTLDKAIKHCIEQAEIQDKLSQSDWLNNIGINQCIECAADHRQLAEWLTELKEAKAIIRVCNRVLGFLLECEIESTSTRHEVETLLKNITKYLSGGSENDHR